MADDYDLDVEDEEEDDDDCVEDFEGENVKN